MAATSKSLSLSIAQMLTAAAQSNEMHAGHAAKETIQSLRMLSASVRGIIACSPHETSYHIDLKKCAQNVMLKSIELIEECKQSLSEPLATDESQQRLTQVARNMSHALYECVNCLPGQRELDNLIRYASSNLSKVLSNGSDTTIDSNLPQITTELNTSALNLNAAANEIVRTGATQPQLAADFVRQFESFIHNGSQLVTQLNPTDENRSETLRNLNEVFANSIQLLTSAKATSADPRTKSQLALAAKSLTESINTLITHCANTSPSNATLSSQKLCDNALRDIETCMSIFLSTPDAPSGKAAHTYYECYEEIFDESKRLGEAISGLANATKSAHTDLFDRSVQSLSKCVCELVSAASHIAYLIGVSHPGSKRAKAGIIEPALFIRASQLIQEGVSSLLYGANHQQLIATASLIAHTAAQLCTCSREASLKTSNVMAKRHFVHSAKNVANNTARLVKAIKSNEFLTEEELHSLTEPLLESIDNLCQFALSPEFMSVPAVMSAAGVKALEPVLGASQGICEASTELVHACKHLIANPKDPSQWQRFSANSKLISEAIKRLATTIKDHTPSVSQCDSAITQAESCVRLIDNALNSPNSAAQNLPASVLQVHHEQAINAAMYLSELIAELSHVAKCEAQRLPFLVTDLAQYLEPMTLNVIASVPHALEVTRNALDATTQLLVAAKECGGNPKNSACHQAIDSSALVARSLLKDLVGNLEKSTVQNGNTATMIDALSKAMLLLDVDPDSSADSGLMHSASDTRLALAQKSHAMQRALEELASSGDESLALRASRLTQAYEALAESCRVSNDYRVRSDMAALGRVCVDLVQSAGECLNSPQGDKMPRRHFASRLNETQRRLAQLQALFGESKACAGAASAIVNLMADLDTVIHFAAAGTLSSDAGDSDQFNNHRESILKTAKSLVEDTKLLVTSAASSEQQLAEAAQSSVRTISELTERVKQGAAALGSKEPDAQVMLMNAVKDVAAALLDLVNTTRNAAEKAHQDEGDMEQLKEAAKKMVTNVQSMLKTVKTVEDEAARGTRALEAASEAIGQELGAFVAMGASGVVSEGEKRRGSEAEMVIGVAKQLTLATSKAVHAGNGMRQDELIGVANLARRTVGDLFGVCRHLVAVLEPAEASDVIRVGSTAASSFRALLDALMMGQKSEAKQRLVHMSKSVAQCVSDLVAIAEALKDAHYVDPEDPTAVAEYELNGAANAIEAAARKLASLEPRRKVEVC